MKPVAEMTREELVAYIGLLADVVDAAEDHLAVWGCDGDEPCTCGLCTRLRTALDVFKREALKR